LKSRMLRRMFLPKRLEIKRNLEKIA
jgi:hypothetical protein